MGLLKKLRGGKRSGAPGVDGRPRWLRDGAMVSLFGGEVTLQAVGSSHYQDNLWHLAEATGASRDDTVHCEVHAVLAPDENPYDPNSISIWVSGLKVGYLSQGDALRYMPGLRALMRQEGQAIALTAAISGGGKGDDGTGMLRIFLSHDPVDFGLPTAAPGDQEPAGHRSSDAHPGDAGGDGDWSDDLPAETVRRLPRLRALLEEARDPIDRHFILSRLEADLYYCRDAFPIALTEYDEVCERHHRELHDGTRDALLSKFGNIPTLDTYKQAAIRHQKNQDWPTALLWAKRGIATYGDAAADPEAVDDLHKRAEKYHSKIRSD